MNFTVRSTSFVVADNNIIEIISRPLLDSNTQCLSLATKVSTPVFLCGTSFHQVGTKAQKSPLRNHTSSNLNRRRGVVTLVERTIGKWSDVILSSALTFEKGNA